MPKRTQQTQDVCEFAVRWQTRFGDTDAFVTAKAHQTQPPLPSDSLVYSPAGREWHYYQWPVTFLTWCIEKEQWQAVYHQWFGIKQACHTLVELGAKQRFLEQLIVRLADDPLARRALRMTEHMLSHISPDDPIQCHVPSPLDNLAERRKQYGKLRAQIKDLQQLKSHPVHILPELQERIDAELTTAQAQFESLDRLYRPAYDRVSAEDPLLYILEQANPDTNPADSIAEFFPLTDQPIVRASHRPLSLATVVAALCVHHMREHTGKPRHAQVGALTQALFPSWLSDSSKDRKERKQDLPIPARRAQAAKDCYKEIRKKHAAILTARLCHCPKCRPASSYRPPAP